MLGRTGTLVCDSSHRQLSRSRKGPEESQCGVLSCHGALNIRDSCDIDKPWPLSHVWPLMIGWPLMMICFPCCCETFAELGCPRFIPNVSLNSFCLPLGSITQRGLCYVLPDTVGTHTHTHMHTCVCMYNAKVFPLFDLARKYLWSSRLTSALNCGEGHVWVWEPPNISKGMCEDRRNLSVVVALETREGGISCFYF